MKIFSQSFTDLEQALNYSSMKQKVISNNIANVDTPNYKAKDVSFKKMFEQSLASELQAYRTDSRHFQFGAGSSSAIVTQRNSAYNQNGNSVDMDKEMADLATNQIYYNALADRVSGKFSSLQSVIKGGR